MLISLLIVSSASTIITIIFWFRLLLDVRDFVSAKQWHSTQGIVHESRIVSVRIARQGGDSSGATFLPEITYQFEYGGQEIKGNRICFGGSKLADQGVGHSY